MVISHFRGFKMVCTLLCAGVFTAVSAAVSVAVSESAAATVSAAVAMSESAAAVVSVAMSESASVSESATVSAAVAMSESVSVSASAAVSVSASVAVSATYPGQGSGMLSEAYPGQGSGMLSEACPGQGSGMLSEAYPGQGPGLQSEACPGQGPGLLSARSLTVMNTALSAGGVSAQSMLRSSDSLTAMDVTPLAGDVSAQSIIRPSGRLTGIYLYQSGHMIDTAETVPVLRYRDGIVFTMEDDALVEYSYFMAGPDSEWTVWTDRAYKEYTNLDAGRYTFKYRYREKGAGDSNGGGSFSFRVRPPWYFSLLALIIYPLLLIAGGIMMRRRTHRLYMERQSRLEQLIAERTEELQHEKEKSDSLLANMLPKGTAEEIMSKGKADKRKYNFVTVLFSDIQGFTKIAEEMNPETLIDELDRFFFHFDSVVEKYRIEKIKTIGDAYMCAGGIPERNRTNPVEVVLAALEMQKYMQEMKSDPSRPAARFWDIRVGIHTGTVVAGVVGHKKITYDIWGDTVNTASRMESSGEAGKINISGTTYEFVKEFFTCDYRGRMPVKYKGDLDMYFVTGIRPELREPDGSPNRKFLARIEMIRILDVEEHVFSRYSEIASPDLFFHSADYIRSISLQADLLARAENLPDEEYIHLRLASIFIYFGYAFDYNDPEAAALKRAGEILSFYGFGPHTLEAVRELIASASSPEQTGMAGRVLHDAVYDFTGRVDFISMVDKLYREEKAYGKTGDPQVWFSELASRIGENRFLTETACRLRAVAEDEQLRALREFAGGRLDNA
jgi:adenylate cyclase